MRRYVARGTELRTVMILVLSALVLPLVAAAQRPAQVRRIAFLGLNFPPAASAPTPLLDAFRHGHAPPAPAARHPGPVLSVPCSAGQRPTCTSRAGSPLARLGAGFRWRGAVAGGLLGGADGRARVKRGFVFPILTLSSP